MKSPVLTYYNLGPDVTAFSSTRHGGYSTGSFGEFNINRYCGDDENAIQKNRRSLCSLLDIADDKLIMPHQTHQTHVALIDDAFLALPVPQRQQQLEGVDALCTAIPCVCIGVSTADCIPLLLYDIQCRAVCAIHAGWRGTLSCIAQKAVDAMRQHFGTNPSDVVAQIGPGISRNSFEVGDEVYEAFLHAGFNMSAISDKREKWHIDLPECNRLQLVEAGIHSESVSISPVCTFLDAGNYFSARRLGISSGRIFTAIMIK